MICSIQQHQELLKTQLLEQHPGVTIIFRPVRDNTTPPMLGIDYLGFPPHLRHQGSGEQIMTSIAAYAQQHHIAFAATPTDLFGADVARLTALLTRHGFLPDPQHSTGYTMVLQPKS